MHRLKIRVTRTWEYHKGQLAPWFWTSQVQLRRGNKPLTEVTYFASDREEVLRKLASEVGVDADAVVKAWEEAAADAAADWKEYKTPSWWTAFCGGQWEKGRHRSHTIDVEE